MEENTSTQKPERNSIDERRLKLLLSPVLLLMIPGLLWALGVPQAQGMVRLDSYINASWVLFGLIFLISFYVFWEAFSRKPGKNLLAGGFAGLLLALFLSKVSIPIALYWFAPSDVYELDTTVRSISRARRGRSICGESEIKTFADTGFMSDICISHELAAELSIGDPVRLIGIEGSVAFYVQQVERPE